MAILQCYAPTNKAEKGDKDDSHEQLQRASSKVCNMTWYQSPKVWDDNTERERMQRGFSVVEPSATTENDVLSFVLTTGTQKMEPSSSTETFIK